MIGDHHQLPPVVQNMAFQKYSRLDQSLFSRFVRLGTPYVELDAQGRARPSIAALYNWRYRSLGDLPRVTSAPEYRVANAGLGYEYQFINVPDWMGRGESTPLPHFFQNLGEAEYVVSLYCFMRLMGYPASKITILTTYNGQKNLLQDVVEKRCAHNPLFGRPHKVGAGRVPCLTMCLCVSVCVWGRLLCVWGGGCQSPSPPRCAYARWVGLLWHACWCCCCCCLPAATPGAHTSP